MTSQIPRAGRWLAAYVHLLVRLHRLFAENRDEGQEGEALRDQMDLPWRRMTPEELRMVRDLSADLYTITDPPPPPVESFPADVDKLVSRALKDEDWVKALRIIRESTQQIPLNARSFLFGYCWSQLGLHEAAAEFFKHAVECQPNQLDYRSYLLCSLIFAGNESEALPYAREWMAESSDPALLLTISNVLFINAELSASGEAARLHELAIQVAERALGAARGSNESGIHDKIVTAYLHIAMSSAYLDDLPKAHAAWQQAMQLAPNSLDTIMVGGLLNQRQFELSAEARRDLVRMLSGVPQLPEESRAMPALPLRQGFPLAGVLTN